MSKEIVTRGSYDLANYSGKTGLEDFGVEDVSMSWLRIAAKNTDAANEDSKDHIEGLKPGFFFVPSLQKVYGKSIEVIPLKYFKSYTEQTTRDQKFVRAVSSHEVKSLVRVGSVFPLPNGNVVKESFNYLVILPSDPEVGILRFSLGAGAFKHIKNWNTLILNSKAALFANVWELTTALATSKDGDTYYSLGAETTLVKKVGPIPQAIEADVIAAFEQAQGYDADVATKATDEEAPF